MRQQERRRKEWLPNLLGIGSSGGGGSVTPVSTSTFTMTQIPTANRVYQRATSTGGGQGLGQGTIPVTIASATAGTCWARIRSSDGTTILQAPWQLASITNGQTSVNVIGVDARLGWFFVDLLTAGGWQLGTTLVGMGRVIFMAGQSLAVRMFGKIGDTTTLAALGLTPSPNGVTFATYEDGSRSSLTPAWGFPADGTNIDSAGAVTILNDQISAFGVQCALVGHTEGATAISAWRPAGAAYTQMTDIMTAVGGWEDFIWFQGHSDSNATSPLAYQALLTDLFADVTARNARGSAYGRRLMSIPTITNGWGTSFSISSLRQTQADWAAANGATAIVAPDVGLIADGVHQTQAGSAAIGRAFSRAMRSLAHPVIVSATRVNGTDIALTVALPAGATSLSSVGSPGTRFRVFNVDNYSTPLALDAVTPVSISGNIITLKLATAVANDVDLDVWFARAYDPVVNGGADMIYDNSSDGLGIGRPILPTIRRVLARAITPVVAPVALTMTTPTYGTSISGFGNNLNGGQGISAGTNTGLPVSGTFTVECVLTTTATAVQVVVGAGTKLWMGVNSAGRFIINVNNQYMGSSTNSVAGTNPIINDGLPHHVAVVVTPDQVRCYVDGVLLVTPVSAPGISAAATSLGVRYAGFGGFNWSGTVDEVATWFTERHTGNFTPPSAPYVGNEAGLFQLWHLDGNGNSGVI